MSHYAFSWFAVPPFFTALCSLAIGSWVFWRERTSGLEEVVLGGATGIAVWLGSFGMAYLATDPSTALLWVRIAHLAIPLLPVAVYLYTSLALRQYRSDKLLIWAAILMALSCVGLDLAGHELVTGVHRHWWGYYTVYGPAGAALAGYFGVVIFLSLSRLWARLLSTVRGSIFNRRIAMCCCAALAAMVAMVDFFAGFGVGVYPVGFVPVLIFLGLVSIMERRHGTLYMTPAVAADQILTTMHGPILVASPEGVLEVGNCAAGRLLGYSEAELFNLPLGRIFAKESEYRTVLRDCLAGACVEDLETSWTRKDGGSVDVSVSASLLRGARDRPLAIVLAAVDLTSRKEAERALGEREEQLRQSHKMEAIGQLAGGIAHDFNNLLTAIIGNSALVLDTMVPEDPNCPLVSDIHEVAERAAALTRQILAFSRRQILRPEVVCLNKVIRDMESLLRRTLGEDVELQLSLAPDLRKSEIDPHQISQVVLNLALNARDAMRDGGRLTIETANTSLEAENCRTHPETNPGEYVMLAISDNGQGMDKETLAHVFEPFFTTKGVGRGTGLGLSTVFGIVKQSGGSVSASSEPGEGATFRVYLPAAARSAASADRPSVGYVAVANGGGNVLVVEDEAPVLRLVVRVLTASGYTVRAAGSAQQAEVIVGREGYRPDLLLADVVLPGGVNGRQVAERLSKRIPGLQVIFMSGYNWDSVVHRDCIHEQAALLEKPFNAQTLLRRVSETMAARN